MSEKTLSSGGHSRTEKRTAHEEKGQIRENHEKLFRENPRLRKDIEF